ncbi:hypothetical protein FA15DRAFT_741109 [Coprinopsis marcescibilis]|uniref:Fungal-type protein kinase domain-containing protein n=1 Tax=Coprinopsis marcescibilis TaxID=230819 RepID=A0A5C3KV55_COPMA|nr:hypothetical protein FA15DRAFT_741109 [Coprinopsis marcescibilis]
MAMSDFYQLNIQKLNNWVDDAVNRGGSEQSYWVRTFASMATDSKIKQYLNTTTKLDNTLTVLENPAAERTALTDATLTLLEDVLNYFPKEPLGKIRQKQPFVYVYASGNNDEIVITGDGPQYQGNSCIGESASTMPWLPELLTLVHIEHKDTSPSAKNTLRRMVPYVVGAFFNQATRNFIRMISIEPAGTFRLAHFDRNGVWYTEKMHKIRDDPGIFIKVVLGLTSSDPEHVGFDSRITWKDITNSQGEILRRVGNIKVAERGYYRKRPVDYRIIGRAPVYRERSSWAVGRDTMGWLVVNKSGRKLFVKDSWHCARFRLSGPPEVRFFETAKENKVVGVARMVQGSEKVYQTMLFRDFGRVNVSEHMLNWNPYIDNMAKSRIVTEVYGSSIREFKTPRQFLYAFHDAVNGHRSLLLDGGILHCDISVKNILLGQPNAKVNWRGVLIDLDCAVYVEDGVYPPTEANQGTRSFQSVTVLSTQIKSIDYYIANKDKYAHDYLDDLEGFFYVLTYFIPRYTGTNNAHRQNGGHPFIDLMNWGNADPVMSCKAKKRLVNASDADFQVLLDTVSDYWDAPFVVMYKKWHGFIRDIVASKQKILDGKSDITMVQLRDQVKEHYETLLGFVSECMASLAASAKGTRLPLKEAPIGVDVDAPRATRSTTRKRDMEEVEDAEEQLAQQPRRRSSKAKLN